MRIRQVKPEFWKDREVASLSPLARLTYIGLWMLADDAGWFVNDLPTIALELYGWESVARREKVVAAALAELAAAGRILTYDCPHALIPTLIHHQRFAGTTKRVYTFETQHKRCPLVPAGTPQPPAGDAGPADPRGSPRTPATYRSVESGGQVRNGQSNARKRDDEPETDDWDARVAETLAKSPVH